LRAWNLNGPFFKKRKRNVRPKRKKQKEKLVNCARKRLKYWMKKEK
jgi:hypothetical protein